MNWLSKGKGKERDVPEPSALSSVGINAPKSIEPHIKFEGSSKKSVLSEDIARHNGFTTFKRVVLMPEDNETKVTGIARLKALLSRDDSQQLRMGSMPSFDLKDRYLSMNLASCMKLYGGVGSKKYPWINVEKMEILIGGAESFFAAHSVIDVRLEDNRYPRTHIVASAKISSSGSSALNFPTDFSVHVDNLSDLNLVLENSNPTMKEGSYWASASISVSLRGSNTALSYGIRPVTGMVGMNATELVNHRHNPTFVDLVVNNEAKRELNRMRKKGLLETLDNSMGQNVATAEYAASEAPSSDRGDPEEEEDGEQEVPVKYVVKTPKVDGTLKSSMKGGGSMYIDIDNLPKTPPRPVTSQMLPWHGLDDEPQKPLDVDAIQPQESSSFPMLGLTLATPTAPAPTSPRSHMRLPIRPVKPKEEDSPNESMNSNDAKATRKVSFI